MSEAEGSNAKEPMNNPKESCHPMAKLKDVIGVFNGIPGQEYRAMEWLLRFNSVASERQWTIPFKLKAAQLYLTSRALEWYSSKITNFTSWTSFESAFKQRFISDENAFQNYVRMKERMQRNDESVYDYVNNKVRLCQSFGMDFANMKVEVLFGLISRELADALQISKYTDKAGILYDIRKYEANNRFPLVQKPEAQKPEAQKPEAQNDKLNEGDRFLSLLNYKFSCSSMARINKCYVIQCVVDMDFSLCLIPEYLANDCHITWYAGNTTVYEHKTKMMISVLGSAHICIEINKAIANDVLIFIIDDATYYHGIIIGSPWCNSSQIECKRNSSGQLDFCNIDRFPYATMDNAVFGHSSIHLMTNSSANLAPKKQTLINALAGKTAVNVLVSNATNKLVTLKANHFLARRVDVIPVTEIECFRFLHKINVNDIQLSKGFTKMKQEKLLKILNKHRKCLVADKVTNITKETINSPLVDINIPDSVLNSAQQKSSSRNTCSQDIVYDTGSPVLRVYKKEKETRFVVHHDNIIVKRPPYPLPPIEEYLQLFVSKTMFTRLDLVHNHLDIPLQTKKKNLDCIIKRFNNAPFEYTGFTNCSTKLVNTETTINYFDHYIVPADDWTDMEYKLDTVLTSLKDCNLTVRLNKCVFASPSIEFLGYEITNDLLKPSHKNVLQIVQCKSPKTIRDIRRFIGLARFFERFLPNFAEVIKPIMDVCRKRRTFFWTDKHHEIFKSFKLQLIKSPGLHLINSKHYTELHIEVTVHLFSAMLYQKKDKDEERKLVHCISKTTSDIEQSYHFNKLILKALLWSLEKLSYWLNKYMIVNIIMDCQSICYMNIMKVTDPECFQHYELLIQKQDLRLIHQATKPIEPKNKNIPFTLSDIQNHLNLHHMQNRDPKIINIITELSEQPNLYKNSYELKNGLLYYISCRKTSIHKLLMIPKIMRKLAVIHFHDLNGHLSLDKTVEIMQNILFFPRLRSYVKIHIKYCSVCTPQKLSRDQRLNAQLGNRPFDTIHIKHSGPFPMTIKGNQYVFVIIDNLTMYTHIYSSPICTTKAMIESLEHFTNKFRLPKRIVSDQSKIFTSLHFSEFCSKNEIQNRQVYGHRPQINKDVELTNNNIISVIYTYINRREVWDNELDILETFLNTTNIILKNISPSKNALNYSTLCEDKIIDILNLDNLTYETKYEYSLRLDFSHYVWKNWFKLNFATEKICIGSIVFLQDGKDSSGNTYLGPMIVIKKTSEFSYVVLQFDFIDFTCYVFKEVHVSYLKIYEGTVGLFKYFTKNNIIGNIKTAPAIVNVPAVPSI